MTKEKQFFSLVLIKEKKTQGKKWIFAKLFFHLCLEMRKGIVERKTYLVPKGEIPMNL